MRRAAPPRASGACAGPRQGRQAGLRPSSAGPGSMPTHLTHLPVEVLLQACDALKRVDIETYTAAGWGEETKPTRRSGWATRRAWTRCPLHPHLRHGPRAHPDGHGHSCAARKEGGHTPPPHLFHRDGSSSCRSTFISSNTFCALRSSSSACRRTVVASAAHPSQRGQARPPQTCSPTSRPASSDRALRKGGGTGQPHPRHPQDPVPGPPGPSEGAEQP